VNLSRTREHGSEQDTRRRLRTVARATAVTGGPLFLLGVLVHQARDGAGIAAAGQVYGITHGPQAISLLLVAVGLASTYALDADGFGRFGLLAAGQLEPRCSWTRVGCQNVGCHPARSSSWIRRPRTSRWRGCTELLTGKEQEVVRS
jgi:hypothetical protein